MITATALLGLPVSAEPLAHALASAAAGGERADANTAFVHPGMLHTAADLEFIRGKLKNGEEPWKTAFEALKKDPIADLNMSPSPVAHVIRGVNNTGQIGGNALGHDGGAAYAHALIAALTGDAVHGRKAIEYIDAWSGMLQSIEGHDQLLLSGLTAYRYCNAAELIRYGAAPSVVWPADRIAGFKAMLTNVFYPPIKDFFPEANGNWDAAMICSVLCIGICLDDRAIFDRAVDAYLHGGSSNGMISNYIYPSGQCEETTRDQGHVQLGLGMMAAACRVAWSQGVDLYSAADNRLALGFEYTAKYNLGYNDVPVDGGPPGEKGRGHFAPIYESIYAHYAIGKGMSLPHTEAVLKRSRPEGYDGSQPSWGTLTAYREDGANAANKKFDILTALMLAEKLFPEKHLDRTHSIASPNGNLVATLALRGGTLRYSLKNRAGHDLLLPSAIGVKFDGDVPPLLGGFALWEVAASKREITRERLWGEHGEHDPTTAPHLPFEQRVLTLREIAAPHRVLRVEFRVYDTGIAFKLTLPPNRDPGTHAKTATEQSTFAFPDGAVAYQSYWNEDEFLPTPFEGLKPGNWLPFTARVASAGPFVSVAEIDDTHNATPQTLLSPLAGAKNTVVTEARGPVTVASEESTPFPWRVILTGETPASLAESNRLMVSLWPESVLPPTDTSWIRPGKAIRETTLSTPGGIACIDFAAARGLKYILFDAGWYGPENSESSDARSVSLDRARIAPNHPGLDLPRVIAYGKEKGIGVFLYVNHQALERQLPELAPLYESWGVAGMKFGFVTVGPVQWTKWMRDSVALCAKHHLMVDIHDAYRPVGVSGSYPNLLTQEGIRGNEHMPSPRHNCTLPFTRFLTGPADYTVCYRVSRLQTTDAHQMALSILYYSPFQMLYWYGRPSEFEGLPELDFFDAVPTVWDETIWIGGAIGEWAAVARRSGRDWFVAAITNEEARTVSIPWDFLPVGTSYKARVYEDKRSASGKADLPLAHGVTRIAIGEREVRKEAAALPVGLAAAGGVAVWVRAG